jgi:hypothetical protein
LGVESNYNTAKHRNVVIVVEEATLSEGKGDYKGQHVLNPKNAI